MSVRILLGDACEQLKALADESVHCVVTSPPYFGLRDYGTASWEGGDPACDHVSHNQRGDTERETPGGKGGSFRGGTVQYQGACNKCGATRTDKQIGLEPTPAEFVAVMVEAFREVRRVLRKDGTLWLNLGDSYASSPAGNKKPTSFSFKAGRYRTDNYRADLPKDFGTAKAKDLLGIPWRVAFALQADGWYLRQDIIWAKPNPMPESVTDRCTKAHEYLFLLTRSPRYHYDAEAIAEQASGRIPGNKTATAPRDGAIESGPEGSGFLAAQQREWHERNRRSVWTVATQPFKEAHFATFPPDLIEPCIKAGCPKDCCAKCGAPVVREVEKSRTFESGSGRAGNMPVGKNGANLQGGGETGDIRREPVVHVETTGWSPSCSCFGHWEERDGPEDWISEETGKRKTVRVYVPDKDPPPTVPGTVLDPFGGAGTTGLVADRLQRNAILIELNPEYMAMAKERISDDAPLFAVLS